MGGHLKVYYVCSCLWLGRRCWRVLVQERGGTVPSAETTWEENQTQRNPPGRLVCLACLAFDLHLFAPLWFLLNLRQPLAAAAAAADGIQLKIVQKSAENAADCRWARSPSEIFFLCEPKKRCQDPAALGICGEPHQLSALLPQFAFFSSFPSLRCSSQAHPAGARLILFFFPSPILSAVFLCLITPSQKRKKKKKQEIK